MRELSSETRTLGKRRFPVRLRIHNAPITTLKISKCASQPGALTVDDAINTHGLLGRYNDVALKLYLHATTMQLL